MKWVFRKNLPANQKAFTLIEVSVALVIFGMITATVLVVMNRAVDTIADWQMKMDAFEVARENMEKLLSQGTVVDMVEYGTSEKNLGIEWEKTTESFYEPISNLMWMRAVCTAHFTDSQGKEQKIELTHWLTSLSKEQVKQVLAWQSQQNLLAAKDANEKSQGQSNKQQNGQQQQEQSQEQQQQEQSQEQQQQEQTKQSSQQADAEAWAQMEKDFGPPPEGYKNWGEVPAEQFLKAVTGKLGNK